MDHCEADDLVTCAGRTTCAHGCSGDHCLALAPSNGLSPELLVDSVADLTGDKLNFDTDSGRIKQGSTTVREPGEGVVAGIGFHVIDGMGVFTAHSFLVGLTDDWAAGGTNAFVLFAATKIEVAGTIDAGAQGGTGGPDGFGGGTSGTNSGCRGGAGFFLMPAFGEGGGGGGGATRGGDGAPSTNATFGAGGTLCATPSTIPLRGGHGGGAGGFDVAANVLRGGRGGGGGGAVALVAMDEIAITGTVGAPGDGGFSASTGDGGGGGGGGGAVLLESPTISVVGALTANGGGGAGPSASTGSRGHFGDAGTAGGGTFGGGSGGRGGAGTTLPGAGQQAGDGVTASRGGGGGGAVGQIELKSIDLVIPPTAVTSPPAKRSTASLQ